MGSGKEIVVDVVVGSCISEHCARGWDRAGDVGVNAWLELHVFWLRLWSWYQRDCETLKHLLKYNYETLSRVADRGVYISFHFVWIVYNHTLASTIGTYKALQYPPMTAMLLLQAKQGIVFFIRKRLSAVFWVNVLYPALATLLGTTTVRRLRVA